MVCPKGHGDMTSYGNGIMKKQYVCPTCDMKLEFDSTTGEVTKATGIFLGIVLLGLKIFGGGGGDHHGGGWS